MTEQAHEKSPEVETDLPMTRLRELVKDLFKPNPLIYWSDFLISVFLGWGAFVLALNTLSFSSIIFVAISCLALYRASLFIHEIAHFKKGSFKLFRVVWSLLCGFPFMIPVFFYQSVHFDHHKQNFYGTRKDGEYFPFALKGRVSIIIHVLFSFLVPIIFLARFAILTPLSLIHKGLRVFLKTRMSALTIDLDYRRPDSSWRRGENWEIQEFLACLFALAFLGAVLTKIIPARVLFLWYCVSALIFLINSIRTLGAHRYKNPEENVMNYPSQMLDSVNIPGNGWMTPLWAPVGLRFHATHHLFPDLPYHALSEAHRRLIQDQGERSSYGKTVCSGLLPVLNQLWKHAAG